MSFGAVLLAVLGIGNAWQQPLPACTPPGAVCAPWVVSQEDIQLAGEAGMNQRLILFVFFSSSIFPKIAFGLVGLLIFTRRSQDWVAQLLALMLTFFSLEGVTNLGGLQPVADGLYAVSTFFLGCCHLSFQTAGLRPDG